VRQPRRPTPYKSSLRNFSTHRSPKKCAAAVQARDFVTFSV
jgi:hypothetical protein